MLTGDHIRYLDGVFAKVCQHFDVALVDCNTEDGHVHMLIEWPPKVPASALVNRSKAPRPAGSANGTGSAPTASTWSPSYRAASRGGAPPSIIGQYVEQQCTLGS